MVTVWNVWIGAKPDDRKVRSVLSGDELDRASSFVFDVHRHRFVAGRLALRELVGRYLDRAPSEVCFAYNAYGKPELPGETLRFNVAHCDDLAVIGLTEHDRLGVDVERIRELRDLDGVARTVFSAHELDVFHALADAAKTRALFDCWTRKEAFVKAVGEGLSRPLDAFDVSLRRGEGSTVQAEAWSLLDFSPKEGWVGAVAVESPEAQLQHAGWLGEPPSSSWADEGDVDRRWQGTDGA